MRTQIALPVLVVACFCIVTFAANPGIQLRLTKRGLDYVNRVAQIFLDKELGKINSLPNYDGGSGSKHYEVHNIRKTGMTPPSSSMSFSPATNSLTLSLDNMVLNLVGDWRYKFRKHFIKISDHGTMNADVKGLGLTASIKLGKGSDGRPVLSTVSCNARMSDVSIKVHGSWASFLYNIFLDFFKDKIKEAILPKMCEYVTNAVNDDGNKLLADIVMKEHFDSDFFFDYQLVSNPKITDKYVEIESKGEVFWEKDVKEAPFTAAPLPETDDINGMLEIWLSDYSVNTYSYSAFTHKEVKGDLNSHGKEMPKDMKAFLQTTCFGMCIGFIFPKLGELYPNTMLNLSLSVPSDPIPKLSIKPDGVTISGKVALDFNIADNGTTSTACSLELDLTLTAQAKIENQRITAQIVNQSVTATVKQSTVGILDPKYTTMFDGIINYVLDKIVVPKVNEVGRQGMALPLMKGVGLTNTKLKLLDGAVFVSSDVVYTVQG